LLNNTHVSLKLTR